MRKIGLFLVIAISLLFSSSCNKENEDISYTFPLQIGNYWEMQHTRNFKNVNNEIIVATDTLRMWAEAAVLSPNGESCIKVRYNYSNIPDFDSYEYLVNRADGLYLLGMESYYEYMPPFYKANENPCRGLFSDIVSAPDPNEIYWFDVPLLVMPHSCTKGKYWTYDYSELSGASYVIISKAMVPTGCGMLSCFTRLTTICGDDYRNAHIGYYYFSDMGLAKYRYDKERTIYESPGHPIGTYNHFEELLLIDCSLN